MVQAHDLSDQLFGSLIATQRAPSVGGKARWLCTCVCGAQPVVLATHLRSGRTRSCGKHTKEGSEHPNWKGVGGLSASYWGKVKSNAKSRGHTVEVTIEYIWGLFLSQGKRCALTGQPLTMLGAPPFGDASLDRIDSNRGYVEGNLQWVHKHVNRAKNDLNQDEFIQMCQAVTRHSKKKGE